MDQTNNAGMPSMPMGDNNNYGAFDASYATPADAGATAQAQADYGMNMVPADMGAYYGGVTDAAASQATTPVSPFAPADIPDVMGTVDASAMPMPPVADNATGAGRTISSDATFAIPGFDGATATMPAGQSAPATTPVASATEPAKPATTPATEAAKSASTTTTSTEPKKSDAKASESTATTATAKPNVLKNEIPKTATTAVKTEEKAPSKKPEGAAKPTITPKTTSSKANDTEVAPATVVTSSAVSTMSSTPTASGVTIEVLLEECIRHNASDLHLQAGLPPILRVDGVLIPQTTYPVLDDMAVQQLVFSTLDSNQKMILTKDREFDYSFAFGDLGRFRVNAFFEKGNMAAAFRLIPNVIKSIEDLGLPGVVSTFADHPNGLVLVTGPTGSGKSTTLAALVDKINNERAVHIITIEDPIEFTHQSKRAVVAQREVHYDTFSFAAALRSILREDPDVVLIGEMRDLETIQAAITVAETGHLVFATLHTNSAAQSIDRMIDVFPAHQQPQVRAQLANILVGICSQRLVPAIDGGRIAVTEIMVTNSAVRSIIREGKTHQLDMTIQTGMSQGMQTMDRELAKFVKSGVISYENAREYAVDTTEFDRLARG